MGALLQEVESDITQGGTAVSLAGHTHSSLFTPYVAISFPEILHMLSPTLAGVVADGVLFSSDDTWTATNAWSFGSRLGPWSYNDTGGLGKYLELPSVVLQAGTYDIEYVHHTDASNMMLQFTLDGAATGFDPLECYSAAPVSDVSSVFSGIVVAADGVHALRMTTTDDGVVPAGGYIEPQGLIFRRTGD